MPPITARAAMAISPSRAGHGRASRSSPWLRMSSSIAPPPRDHADQDHVDPHQLRYVGAAQMVSCRELETHSRPFGKFKILISNGPVLRPCRMPAVIFSRAAPGVTMALLYYPPIAVGQRSAFRVTWRTK